jgi:predicted DNA-binding transcriptional regulator AlpA
MAKGNPHPDTKGLGSVPVGWDDGQITDFIHKRIKGLPYTAPAELPERPTIIRKREVIKRTGLSYPTIWALERDGRFPARVALIPSGPSAQPDQDRAAEAAD